MRHLKSFSVVFLILVALLTTTILRAQPFTPPFDQDGVLSYLEQVISLQQNAAALQVDTDGTRETILFGTLQQNTANASKFAFEFAQAQADLLDKPVEKDKEPDPDAAITSPTELMKFAKTVSERIQQLEANLVQVNKKISQAPRTHRATLLAQRENITGELNLAKAQNELIDTLSQTVKSTSDAEIASGLHKKIDDLSKSISSLTPQPLIPTKDNAKDISADTTANDAVDTKGGLFRMGADLLGVWQKQAQIRAIKQQVKDLRTLTKDMRTQLRTALQSIARGGNTLAQESTADKTLVQQRQDFDTLVNNFKTLSNSVVPLSQTNFWLDNAKQTMKEWQNVSDQMLAKTAQEFLVHLALLGIAILIPIVLSEVARRTTVKYVKDARRQRQLRLLRRIIFGIVILLIITLNLVSEIGSLATFAGFLTAGIAVALQNIILSLVAHFFFFGRYGVRAGDRVTVGGVTGDVTQVGMVRLYLMEVEGTGEDTRPSGRIVAFPNSILFQPTAFFKHITAA